MPCIADWEIDHSNEFYMSAQVSKLCESRLLNGDTIPTMKGGDIVFVKTDYLKNNFFQREILPEIKVPFMLISGISSFEVDNYVPILENEFVMRWYCTNPPIKHEKIIGLPIGFEEAERDGGNQKILHEFLSKSHKNKRNKILLPYHTLSTNTARNEAASYLKELPFVDVQTEKLKFDEYLELLAKYKYCICLEGAGFDTHRNYECLLVNTLPIMKQSNIKLIYDDWNLPYEFVTDWKSIDKIFFTKISNTRYNYNDVNEFFDVKSHLRRILNDSCISSFRSG